jgi:hypothetical protein
MMQLPSKAQYLFHSDFLPGLFFDPEHGGDMFLRNIGCSKELHGVISKNTALVILNNFHDKIFL